MFGWADGVLLGIAVLALLLPRRWQSSLVATVFHSTGLLAAIGCSLVTFDHRSSQGDWIARTGALVAVVWLMSFGWSIWTGARPERRSARIGWQLWTATGLIWAGRADDLFVLALAVEMVRRGTMSRNEDFDDDVVPFRQNTTEQWVLPALCAALAGWSWVTGSLEIASVTRVLERSYGTVDPLGRPSLVLVGAWALWVLAGLTPLVLRISAAQRPGDAEPLPSVIASLCARGAVAQLSLIRVCEPGLAGLESTVLTLILVLGFWGGVWTIRLASSRTRVDRLLLAAILLQQCQALLMLLPLLGRSPHRGSGLVLQAWSDPQGWMTTSLCLSPLMLGGICATLAIAFPTTPRQLYLEQCRGWASLHVGLTLGLLAPLASLIGVPFTSGFWLRWSGAAAILGVHTGASGFAMPDQAVMGSMVIHGLALVAVLSAVLHWARVILLESPAGMPMVRRDVWACLIAAAAAGTALAGGLIPEILFAAFSR